MSVPQTKAPRATASYPGGRRVVRRVGFYDSVDARRAADIDRAGRTAAAKALLGNIIAAGRRKNDDATLSQLAEVRRVAGDRVYFSPMFQKRLTALRSKGARNATKAR